jgi:hypothetical protein
VVCAPLDWREALLAAVLAETRVWQALRAVALAGLPGAAAALDGTVRAGPGELGGAAEPGVLAAVRVALQVLDEAAEPGVLVVVRVAPRVLDGAGAQDVPAAVPAESRLAPPAWWAVCA